MLLGRDFPFFIRPRIFSNRQNGESLENVLFCGLSYNFFRVIGL